MTAPLFVYSVCEKDRDVETLTAMLKVASDQCIVRYFIPLLSASKRMKRT